MKSIPTLALAAALVLSPLPAATQQAPFVLEGLVVTASPTPRAAGDVARFVTVLEGDVLRAQGLTSVADALRAVPGVAVVQGGSFGAVTSVFLRGGESDHVQVLVDGVPVNQPGGSFDFSGLLLHNVERIEVVRGPASSLYGSDAMAGVIHVITRTGRGGPSGEVSLRGGSFARREASARAEEGGGVASWSTSVTRLSTDGVYARNSGFENRVASAHVRLAPDLQTRASVALRLAERTHRFPTDGSGAVTDENAFTFGDEASVALTAARALSARLELRGSLAIAQTDGGTDDQPDSPADTLGTYAFTSLDHMRRTVADVRAHLTLPHGLATFGVEVEEQKQRSFSQVASQWGPSVGRSGYGRQNRAAFVHLTGAREGFSFAAGSRLEDNERFGRFASWNAEVGWRWAAGTRLRASAGRGMKEPTFFENFARGWVRGNPDLLPERSRSVEVGLEQEGLGGRGVVRATVFTQRLRDLIQYVAFPAAVGDPNYVNVAAAATSGMELAAEGRVGPVVWGGDWSWTRTEVLEANTDDGEGADFVPGSSLLRRPRHAGGVHATLSGAWGTLRMDVRVVGSRADRDFSSWPARRVELPRHQVVSLGGEVPVGRVVLGVRAENLLDARYEDVSGYPAPGRGLYLGGRVPFGGG